MFKPFVLMRCSGLNLSATESSSSTRRDISRCGSRASSGVHHRAFIISQLSVSEKKRWTRGIFSWPRRWSKRTWTRMRPKKLPCLGCTINSKSSGKIVLGRLPRHQVQVLIAFFFYINLYTFREWSWYLRGYLYLRKKKIDDAKFSSNRILRLGQFTEVCALPCIGKFPGKVRSLKFPRSINQNRHNRIILETHKTHLIKFNSLNGCHAH